MRLISSESAWTSSSVMPSGISSSTGQRIKPPAFCDISLVVHA